MKYTAVQKAFGKVVINPSTKKFSFYFDGKLICTMTHYLSYINDKQGGEGFSLDNGYSAHRFTAERTFQIYYQSGMGDPGNEYEIINYRIN